MDRSFVDVAEKKDVEEDKILQLMIENKVLECEKKRAESEVDCWKAKCEELTTKLLILENKLCPSCQKHRFNPVETINASSSEGHMEDLGRRDGIDVASKSANFRMGNSLPDCNEKVHAVDGVKACGFHPVAGKTDLPASGTPSLGASGKASSHFDEWKLVPHFGPDLSYGNRVRKRLRFDEERSPCKKLAPSTPGVERPSSIAFVDLSESDEELDIKNSNTDAVNIQENVGVCDTSDRELVAKDSLKTAILENSDGDDISVSVVNCPSITTQKRKRASNVVASDSESCDDDKILISQLRSRLSLARNAASHSYRDSMTCSDPKDNSKGSVGRRRRRLVKLTESESKEGFHRSSSNACDRNRNSNVKDDSSTGDDGSESEGNSLGGFIVDGSEDDAASFSSDTPDGSRASYADAVSGESGAVSADSGDGSDSGVDYSEIISRFHRKKGNEMGWEFEADMLASFGQDLELCMKAVCALYRQQTSDEQATKGTIHSNQRGFSQCDAHRGTTLAEFLTDGDPYCDSNKSVEELKAYDSRGPELCRSLATRYSKQLFAIYKNKEDPFFRPDNC